MSFLITCVLIVSVIALIDNPCITNFRMENIDNIGTDGEYGQYSTIVRDCTNGVVDQSKNIYSVSSQSRCWVNINSFTQIVEGKTINRCGECLEIYGSSMGTHYCSIVGAFETNVSNETDIERSTKLIFVDSQLYQLISDYSGSHPLTFPINFNLVHCPYSVYPGAIITSTIQSEEYPGVSIAEVNLFNTNLVILKVMIDNVDYYANLTTCLYHIPVTTNGVLKIFNIFGQSSLIDFDFNSTDAQVANSPLPKTISDNVGCDYRAYLNIVGNVTETDDFFKWQFRFSNDTNLTNGVILPNEEPEFDIQPLSYGTFSFTYPTPFIASKLFGFFYMEIEVSHQMSLPYPLFYSMYGDNFAEATRHIFSRSIVLNFNDSTLENGYVQRIANVSVRIAGSYGYSNVWMLRYYNSENITQHWIVKKMFMTDSTSRTYQECDISQHKCTEEDECDPTGSIIPPDDGDEIKTYIEGCVPYCGKCKTGYVCNQAAKCVRTPNYNTRSGGIIPFILLPLVLLVLF